jgi:transcriptional regulator with GAF, ATPase, and Fis domain
MGAAMSERQRLDKGRGSVDLGSVLDSDSERMREALGKLRAVAPTRTTVLLGGETGTGKGVLARAIHELSQRRGGPFVAVHCGAIPETLLESELFGHERGAFTGAVRRKPGRFEIANGGTLFLDEVGTISPAMQIKLLQVLQEWQFQRVGGEQVIEADVRIVAASNVDLSGLVDEGRFRLDLFYRLSVFPIEVPPLRERIEDLPRLVAALLERLTEIHGGRIQGVEREVLHAFAGYAWPGNVRELENLLERACILEGSDVLGPASFPAELFTVTRATTAVPVDTRQTLAEARKLAADAAERAYLTELLARYAGRVGRTAEAAGITPRQLHKLMTKHSLHKEQFRSPRRPED